MCSLAQNSVFPDIVATGLAAARENGKPQPPSICVFNTVTKEEWVVPVDKTERAIVAVGFSCDGKLLAACGDDEKKTVTVWDWRTQTKIGWAA